MDYFPYSQHASTLSRENTNVQASSEVASTTASPDLNITPGCHGADPAQSDCDVRNKQDVEDQELIMNSIETTENTNHKNEVTNGNSYTIDKDGNSDKAEGVIYVTDDSENEDIIKGQMEPAYDDTEDMVMDSHPKVMAVVDSQSRQDPDWSSMGHLAPGVWLSDEEVNSLVKCLARLSTRDGQTFKAVSSFHLTLGNKPQRYIVDMLATSPEATLFLPIYMEPHDHWTLSILRPRELCVDLYDSLPNTRHRSYSLDVARDFVARYFDGHLTDWIFTPAVTPRQPNKWDCGIYTILCAFYAASGRRMPVDIPGDFWRMTFYHILEVTNRRMEPKDASDRLQDMLQKMLPRWSITERDLQDVAKLAVEDANKKGEIHSAASRPEGSGRVIAPQLNLQVKQIECDAQAAYIQDMYSQVEVAGSCLDPLVEIKYLLTHVLKISGTRIQVGVSLEYPTKASYEKLTNTIQDLDRERWIAKHDQDLLRRLQGEKSRGIIEHMNSLDRNMKNAKDSIDSITAYRGFLAAIDGINSTLQTHQKQMQEMSNKVAQLKRQGKGLRKFTRNGTEPL